MLTRPDSCRRMKHLKNLISGFFAIFSETESPAYPNLSGGFAKDKARLRHDARQVNQTINKACFKQKQALREEQ